MEIDSIIENIQEEEPHVIKAKDKNNTEMEIKKLQTQLNNHLKNKLGQRYKKVSILDSTSTNCDQEAFNDLVNDEMTNKFVNKKWSKLPLFMKWNLVKTYLDEKNITDNKTIKLIKEALSKNRDIFVYDNINNKITDITI